MSKRQVLILWSIAAVLALLIFVVKLLQGDPQQASTKRKPGQTLFENFPAQEVTSMTIKSARRTLTISRQGEDWVLPERDNYPANPTVVLEHLRILKDLEITRAIEAGPSFAPRFGMDPEADDNDDHGFELTFHDEDGEQLAHVTIGKVIENESSSPSPLGGAMTVGRYIRNHADESGFYASSEMFPSMTDEPGIWLRDTFINPEKIQSVSVTKPDSEEVAWKLSRASEEAAFQLVDGAENEVANASIAGRLGSLLSYAHFQDVVPAADVESRSSGEGQLTAVIETFEGFTYTIKVLPTAIAEEFLMQVTVDAQLPETRKPAEGETEEQAKAADEAFTTRRQQLQDKLNEAKFFQGRTYVMLRPDVELLLRKRSEMVTTVQPEAGGQPPEMLTPAQP